MDTLRKEMAAVNAKTDKLQVILMTFEDMNKRIQTLE